MYFNWTRGNQRGWLGLVSICGGSVKNFGGPVNISASDANTTFHAGRCLGLFDKQMQLRFCLLSLIFIFSELILYDLRGIVGLWYNTHDNKIPSEMEVAPHYNC